MAIDQPVAAAPIAALHNGGASPPFFPVSMAKFIVLTVCTLGAYQLFWFYRNWQRA